MFLLVTKFGDFSSNMHNTQVFFKKIGLFMKHLVRY